MRWYRTALLPYIADLSRLPGSMANSCYINFLLPLFILTPICKYIIWHLAELMYSTTYTGDPVELSDDLFPNFVLERASHRQSITRHFETFKHFFALKSRNQFLSAAETLPRRAPWLRENTCNGNVQTWSLLRIHHKQTYPVMSFPPKKKQEYRQTQCLLLRVKLQKENNRGGGLAERYDSTIMPT